MESKSRGGSGLHRVLGFGVWNLEFGILELGVSDAERAPDVSRGINALCVDAGMALNCALPPRVDVLLEMQNLAKFLLGSQK
jgi:hypothetical protein